MQVTPTIPYHWNRKSPMNYKSRIQTYNKIQKIFHHGVNLQSPICTKIIAANIKKIEQNIKGIAI
jgi:hypothetical protein